MFCSSCNGGFPASAWVFYKDTGLVSGGQYNSHQVLRPVFLRKVLLLVMKRLLVSNERVMVLGRITFPRQSNIITR